MSVQKSVMPKRKSFVNVKLELNVLKRPTNVPKKKRPRTAAWAYSPSNFECDISVFLGRGWRKGRIRHGSLRRAVERACWWSWTPANDEGGSKPDWEDIGDHAGFGKIKIYFVNWRGFKNPSNIMKHMGDPAVKKLLSKLGSRFGAEGPATGKNDLHTIIYWMQLKQVWLGVSDHSNEDAKSSEQSPMKKAPEPELDWTDLEISAHAVKESYLCMLFRLW